MPAREKTSVTFLAAAVEGLGTLKSVGETVSAGLADGCSAGPRYKPVRGELMRRSSRSVAPIILRRQRNYKADLVGHAEACQPAARPAVPGRATLFHRLRHQFDVLLARGFALGILPDPGFPVMAVRHVAAGEGKPDNVGVADRSPVACLCQDAHRRPGEVAIEDVALQGFPGV